MRVLDLFSCEGGATAGFQCAGFEVFAVDLDKPVARHNPADGFYRGDALVVLVHLLAGGEVHFVRRDGTVERLRLKDFAFIHASPPCQGYTRGNAGKETSWPKLIPDVRVLLDQTGLPYSIENVEGAAPAMLNPTLLCGCMFDLTTVDTDGVTIHLQRPRLFETNWPLTAPRGCDHSDHDWVAGAYGGARRDKYEAKYVRKGGYVPKDKDVVKALLGVEHDMTWKGLFECIPPAYARHVAEQVLLYLDQKVAVSA